MANTVDRASIAKNLANYIIEQHLILEPRSADELEICIDPTIAS
jgi:hypothetical protein